MSAGKCPICGKRLEDVQRKYCSTACAKAAKKDYQAQYQRDRRAREREASGSKKITWSATCLICGGPVELPRRKYCKDECYAVAAGRRSKEVSEMVRRGEHVRQKQGPRGQYHRRAGNGKQRRECLKCGQKFLSTGPDNRLCNACRQENRDWQRHGGNEEMMYAAALWE